MTADLLASRELAWRMLVRDLRGQYRQSLLGYLWVLLPPLATTLTWLFLNSAGILNVGPTDIPYPVHVLVGTLLWQGFVDALNMPLRQLAAARALLTKISFPREALLLSGLGMVLFNFVVRLALVVVMFLGFRLRVPATILLAPVGVAALLVLGTTLGLLLTPLGMLYHDIPRGLGIITAFWFFATPVVYPVPTRWPAVLVVHANPVTPLLVTTRELLTTGHLTQGGLFLVVTGLSVLLLLAAWLLYRLAMPHLIERLAM